MVVVRIINGGSCEACVQLITNIGTIRYTPSPLWSRNICWFWIHITCININEWSFMINRFHKNWMGSSTREFILRYLPIFPPQQTLNGTFSCISVRHSTHFFIIEAQLSHATMWLQGRNKTDAVFSEHTKQSSIYNERILSWKDKMIIQSIWRYIPRTS